MRKLISLLVMFLLSGFGCTSSCKNKRKDQEQSQNHGEAAAIVNGHKISLKELEDLHNRGEEQIKITGYGVDKDASKKMRASLLKKMIDDKVIRQKADTLGIRVDRFERVEGLERYKARLGGEQAFQAFLKRRNLSEAQVLETVVDELTRTKLIQKLDAKLEVTEEEIKNHYESNKNFYVIPPMVHVRHILFKVAKTDSPEKIAVVLKKVQNVLAEAHQPGASFEALAQKYSEGPSAHQKGDLGFFPRGRMVKEFEDAAFNAPLKTAVGPVKTDYGFHVIYVEEKTPEKTASLSEVHDRIHEFVLRSKQSRKSESILTSLRKSADVKIYDSSLTEEEYRQETDSKTVAAKAQ